MVIGSIVMPAISTTYTRLKGFGTEIAPPRNNAPAVLR